MGFQADLDFGKEGEKLVPYLIEYDTIEIKDGYFPDYDVLYTYQGVTSTIECKRDRWTHKTGNIAIEFESYGKPSGIRTTKAEHYFYFVAETNHFYIIPTSEIRKQVKRKAFTSIKRVGDNGRNLVYLFPERIFENFFNTYEIEGLQVSPPWFINDE
jgi:hypothetical protein